MIIQLDEDLIVNTDCIMYYFDKELFLKSGERFVLSDESIHNLKRFCTTSLVIHNKDLNVEIE